MKLYCVNLHVYLRIILFVFALNLQLQQANALGNETDRLALLQFKQGITNDPQGIFNSWNDSVPFCNWYGVRCSRHHQRVASLVFQGQNLIGSISPNIGNLSFLRILDLRNNSLRGPIPPQVGNLFRLQQLILHNNSLDGEIPTNLSNCSQLRRIVLQGNNLSGQIPEELGGLAKLEMLVLAKNNLTGEIPPSLGNLSSLFFFSVLENNLVGSIPDSLGRLTSLKVFFVAVNHLTGIIPPSLFNISSVNAVSFLSNQFHGTLPDNMGLTLPNIQDFGIGQNDISGSIPNSFSNASQLQILSIGSNKFTGQVPNSLGNLNSLWWLEASDNYLGSNSTDDWVFFTSLKNCSKLSILDLAVNNFGGILPNSLGNFSSQLSKLYLTQNQISGTIPVALQHFINLIVLALGGNLFTGDIPHFLGKLQKLQLLELWENSLSGQIPSSIGNLTQLFSIDLSSNKLEGTIPASVANCNKLQRLNISYNLLKGNIPKEILGLSNLILLDLSGNSFTDSLPTQVGKLTNLNLLDVSHNRLIGQIPGLLGNCLILEYLYMQGNSFQGSIPPSFASLKGLQVLDLSRNNLTGQIPKDLQTLPFLLYLNLSFNDLEGEIPTRGVFTNSSALSLFGNNKLCGGLPELHLPKCPTKLMRKGKSHALKLAVIITCILALVLLFLALLFAFQRRKSKKSSSSAPLMMDSHRHVKLSYQDLHQATSGFSSNNLIGSGSFGSVYKGFLNREEKLVAVKVLKLEEKGACKSFMAECKALRNVRHRNLVKLLTYCSSLDYKRNEFKALIFEFMEKGSLDKWLHHNTDGEKQSTHLNLLERLNIAIDVASAIHYLHDLCESQIIHCDLKPSNILLDDNMVAHVSDFGLAKLFLTTNETSLGHTSSVGIKGTIGYAPPEYGMGGVVSKEGDVYSFGILVLELFSGKKPTDRMFENGLSLHNFVKNALPERLVQIVDPTMLPGETEQMGTNEKECLLSVFKVGVACSTELPKERMKMGDVAKQLNLFRSTFIGVRIYG